MRRVSFRKIHANRALKLMLRQEKKLHKKELIRHRQKTFMLIREVSKLGRGRVTMPEMPEKYKKIITKELEALGYYIYSSTHQNPEDPCFGDETWYILWKH